MTSETGGEVPLEPSTKTFEEREKIAVFLFDLATKHPPDTRDFKEFISYMPIEALGDDSVQSPIRIRGEILERGIEDNKHFVTVWVWSESVSDEDLPFEPPTDYRPDEDELERLILSHGENATNLEPVQAMRKQFLGDMDEVMISRR